MAGNTSLFTAMLPSAMLTACYINREVLHCTGHLVEHYQSSQLVLYTCTDNVFKLSSTKGINQNLYHRLMLNISYWSLNSNLKRYSTTFQANISYLCLVDSVVQIFIEILCLYRNISCFLQFTQCAYLFIILSLLITLGNWVTVTSFRCIYNVTKQNSDVTRFILLILFRHKIHVKPKTMFI